nr:MerR family transcriptional regulator [Plantactinospora soyae]
MLSIGEMARASGLSVSALRFYDGAGVLAPALVDPGTGYRRYAQQQVPAARLVAGLRRVGMPLAEITRLLDLRASSPAAVPDLLDAHLRRLEDGLGDARREIFRLRALFTASAQPMVGARRRLTVPGRDLAAAVDAVRFAVGDDPELPMLGGVQFEVDGSILRLVATDRYRMAFSEVGGDLPETADLPPEPADPAGTTDRLAPTVFAPVGFVDEARNLLTGGGPATVVLDTDGISLRFRDRQVTGTALGHDFPDYRRLLRETTGGPDRRRVTVDVAGLRERLAATETRTVVREDDGAPCAVSVLMVDAGNALTVSGADAPPDPDVVRVGVNREFLLDALDAAGPGQLVLELDGPIRPLAVRRLDDDRAFSILMPIRL